MSESESMVIRLGPPVGYHMKQKTKKRKKTNKKRTPTTSQVLPKEVPRKIWSPTPELSAYQFAFSATSHKTVSCVCVCACAYVCVCASHYQSALRGMLGNIYSDPFQATRSLSFSLAVAVELRVLSRGASALAFHVILVLLCSISATFGPSMCVCVRVCRMFVSPRLRRLPSLRDKVLSYDLLKCPNATITRDYYKCIPRVQRPDSSPTPSQDAHAHAANQQRARERERENVLQTPTQHTSNMLRQLQIVLASKPKKWNLKSHGSPPLLRFGPSFCLRSSKRLPQPLQDI